MARGWESKSVEMQLESAEANRCRPTSLEPSAEESEKARERQTLGMSRTRILNDLAKASNPRYRQLLLASLEFLDQKLKRLE